MRLASAETDADIERVARRFLETGDLAAAFETLSSMRINVTAHGEGALPCLCRRCAVGEVRASLDGVGFVRDFVVHRGRVLHFWVPEELISGARSLERLRRSVRDSFEQGLTQRLSERTARRRAKRRAHRTAAPVAQAVPGGSTGSLPIGDDDIPF